MTTAAGERRVTTVGDLKRFLESFPDEMVVATQMYSEQMILQLSDIEEQRLGVFRLDGWIPDYRDDKSHMTYLVFPGN